jgi:hypothetical protein
MIYSKNQVEFLIVVFSRDVMAEIHLKWFSDVILEMFRRKGAIRREHFQLSSFGINFICFG